MFIAPFLGWLPGPGGIPLFLVGLSLVATNHEWAENILKDFDDKRRVYTDKFLRGNRVQTVMIDLISIILMGLGVYVNIIAEKLWQRGLGACLFTFGLLLIISNQDRIDRFLKRLKRSSKH